ncbi:MAG: hypothetical protein Q7S26_03060 [bacterium]|nr:hypothetical protein [bacterium]
MSSFLKLLWVFLLSLGLNIVWENAHVFLYASYQSAPITKYILLRASVGDAIILTLLAIPFLYWDFFRKRIWLIIPLGVVVSIFIELYALHTGRWAYNEYMPLIQFLSIGLAPTIQLGLLGFLVYLIVL